MPSVPPQRVEAGYRCCGWWLYLSLVAGVVAYGISLCAYSVFVPEDNAPSESHTSFNWGSMPKLMISLTSLRGTWAFRGINVATSGDQPFFGFKSNPDDNLAWSILTDENTSMLLTTDIYYPTFRPLDMIEGSQNNQLELYFSVWLPSLQTTSSEVWLQAQVYTLIPDPQVHTSLSVSPLANVPLGLCIDNPYRLTSISLEKVRIQRSCSGSFFGFSRCDKVQFEKENDGQVDAYNIEWPTNRVPFEDGDTFPTEPNDHSLYCGAISITVQKPEVRVVIIRSQFLRLVKVLGTVGGLFNYVGLVFAVVFVPKFAQKVVPLTFAGKARSEIYDGTDSERGAE